MNTLMYCSLVFTSSIAAMAGEMRVWTDAASGQTLEGSLEKVVATKPEILVKRKDNGKIVPVEIARLTDADKDYVKEWKPHADAPAGGISIGRVGVLDQAVGGKKAVMLDLEYILSKYGKAENDLAPHPDVTVYEGPSPGGLGKCRVTYLMPRVNAEVLLFKNRGIVSKKPAVAPGFPPGMILYSYDIRFLIYNRLILMVDQADQVVTLQFKAEHKFAPADWEYMDRDFSTFDYIGVETRNDPFKIWTHVKPWKDYIVVNMAAESRNRETNTWYLPKPLLNLILFNMRQDARRN